MRGTHTRHLFSVAPILLFLGFFSLQPSLAADREVVELNNNGVIAINKKDPDKAIALLLQALVKDPTYKHGRDNLAIALKMRAQSDKTDDVSAVRDLVIVLLMQPESTSAREALVKRVSALGKDPKKAETYTTLAADREKSGDRLGAYAEYKEAQKIKFDEAIQKTAERLRKEMINGGEALIDLSDECQD